jgi:hypothetical protein
LADFEIPYKPQARQKLLHKTKARQILYGGAAGGGKSQSIRWDAIMFCLQNPGCQAYLFRKTLPELEDNHIKKMRAEVPDGPIGSYNHSRKTFDFSNGSALVFCYCDRDDDVHRYLGAEMHWVGIDEAARFTEYQISYLKTRNRLGSWVPDRDKELLPRFVMATNPGGPAHTYLKQIFLDQVPPETLFYDDTMKSPSDKNDQGWLSIFIPAKMADNRYLDTGYAGSFGALTPELAKALRDGDWDAVVGQALHTLSRDRHQLRRFDPPKHWTRFMVMDWGTASPFSIGWFTVSEGAILAGRELWPERWLPPGALIMYDEWYGWNGRANQGLRLAPQQVARGIIDREQMRNDAIDYRIADSECWAMKSGPSVVEWMAQEDARLIFRRSEKDRKRNYMEVLARLAGNPRVMDDGQVMDDPMLFVTENCTHFWRTVPPLVLDEVDHEKGPDTKQEDHCLIGSTKVYTPEGQTELAKLPKTGKILTHHGFMPYINLGMTQENAEIYRLELEDGQVIEGTGGHPVLCADLRYRRIDELAYNDYILCANPKEASWGKSSSARPTGSAENTTSEKALDCTESYGNTTTGQSLRVSIAITRMATSLTTQSKTWSFFQPPFISGITLENRTALLTPNGIWKQECGLKPLSGTGQSKDESGTGSNSERLPLLGRVLNVFVRNVASLFSPDGELSKDAPALVSSALSAVGIRGITRTSRKENVYNIHVPDIHCFIVGGGAIVHNCYDQVAYACRSRPYISTPEDRYRASVGDEADKARGKIADPYAT